jgi:hypothetical protein
MGGPFFFKLLWNPVDTNDFPAKGLSRRQVSKRFSMSDSDSDSDSELQGLPFVYTRVGLKVRAGLSWLRMRDLMRLAEAVSFAHATGWHHGPCISTDPRTNER